MMMNEIKSLIQDNVNKKLAFKINGSRNQIEKFSGKIVSLYNSIFLVEDIDTGLIRSFTYSDVLTKNLVIYFK